MNSNGLIQDFLKALQGNDIWTMVAKLVIGILIVVLGLFITGKIKKAQNDAANEANKAGQGKDQAGTGQDTDDIAKDADDAASKIDDIHRREN